MTTIPTAAYRVPALGFTPDQLATLGGWIAREWGDFGYRIIPTGRFHAAVDDDGEARRYDVFEVSHRDGSRFQVGVDRWGNHIEIGDV